MTDLDLSFVGVALSWSRISDFRSCPHKFNLKYNHKEKIFFDDAKKSPHLIRGKNTHSGLESYVVKKKAGEKNISSSNIIEVEKTKPLIDGLMNIYDIHPELQIAVDKNFNQVEWYSKDAWFRVIMDLIGFGKNLFIGDFKTGKLANYEGTLGVPGQLHMSSLIGMALWPQYEEVDNRYIYVDHRTTIDLKLNRQTHFQILKDCLIKEHAEINAEKNYDPKMNQFCKWCQATKKMCNYSRKI